MITRQHIFWLLKKIQILLNKISAASESIKTSAAYFAGSKFKSEKQIS